MRFKPTLIAFAVSATATATTKTTALAQQNNAPFVSIDATERETFAAITKLFERPDAELSEAELAQKQQLRKLAWAGENANLRSFNYKEPSTNFPLEANLMHFLETRRHLAGPTWWIGGEMVGTFNSKTSKSLLRVFYGNEGEREVFWPVNDDGSAQLSEFRLAINYTPNINGRLVERSAEIFFRNPKTREPEPYLIFKIGAEWLPATGVFGKPLKEGCANCHAKKEDGKLRSFPWMIFPDGEKLKESGYHPEFIEALLAQDASW